MGLFDGLIKGVSEVIKNPQYILPGFAAKENLDYQKSLQQELFAREDSSIQRRVFDLKSAGLSPVLAAGQGAAAGPVVSTQAPNYSEIPTMVMSLLKMKQDIAQSDAYTSLMREQKDKVQMETLNEWIKGEGSIIENAGNAHDLSRSYKTGVSYKHPSTVGNITADAFNAIERAGKGIEHVKKVGSNMWNTYDSAMKSLFNKLSTPATQKQQEDYNNR